MFQNPLNSHRVAPDQVPLYSVLPPWLQVTMKAPGYYFYFYFSLSAEQQLWLVCHLWQQRKYKTLKAFSEKQTRNKQWEQGPALPFPSSNSVGCISTLRKRFDLLLAALKMVKGKRTAVCLHYQSEVCLQKDFYTGSCTIASPCQALENVSATCLYYQGYILPLAKTY